MTPEEQRTAQKPHLEKWKNKDEKKNIGLHQALIFEVNFVW